MDKSSPKLMRNPTGGSVATTTLTRWFHPKVDVSAVNDNSGRVGVGDAQ